jgi:xanthine dehydrogenase YagS FAD-binding subunit
MKSFEYASPETVEEAVSLLSNRWGETEILAGGTDLITSLKQGITQPERVVSLKNIRALRGIQGDKETVRIGAMTSLEELAGHKTIRKHFPAVVTAIQSIGSPQIIAVGTAGGDLCQRPRCWYFRSGYGLLAQQNGKSLVQEGDNRYHAIFGNEGPAMFVSASSLAPVLVALGARVAVARSKEESREVPAEEFFKAPGKETERETVLRPNELLTSIIIPIQGLSNATYEVRHRDGLDWPYVTATVVCQVKNGRASNSRVVLGHVAPAPWSASKAAEVLNSGPFNPELAARCGDAATQGAKPLSRNAYKVPMVKTAVKRAALAAIEA